MPDLKEFEAMADHIIAAGFYSTGEMIGTTNAERAQLCMIMAEGRAGCARLIRKMLGAEAPRTEAGVKKVVPFKGVGIFVSIKANEASEGFVDSLRPRQGAANIFSEALYEGNRACPPYSPFELQSSPTPRGPCNTQPASKLPK